MTAFLARSRCVLICAIVLFIVACGDDQGPSKTGGIRVTVEFSGAGLDQAGPVVTLDDTAARQGVAAPVEYAEVASGEHEVALRGLHARCTRTGSASQSVAVTVGQTTEVQYAVECRDIDQLAFLIPRSDAPGGVSLAVIDADGQRQHEVFDPRDRVAAPAWTRDGRRLAIRYSLAPDEERGAVWSVNADGTELRKLWSDPTYTPVEMSWSPDGGRLAVRANYNQFSSPIGGTLNYYKVVLMDADGGNVVEIPPVNGNMSVASWAPDGMRFVLSVGKRNPGDEGLEGTYIADRQGSALTPRPAPGSGPQWSPDGQTILLTFPQLYTLHPDGTDLTEVPACPIQCRSAYWSPDGSRLAVDDVNDVRVVGPDGSVAGPVINTDGISGGLGWSATGSYLAWTDYTGTGITVIGSDGGNRRPINDQEGPLPFPPSPAWRP